MNRENVRIEVVRNIITIDWRQPEPSVFRTIKKVIKINNIVGIPAGEPMIPWNPVGEKKDF